MKKSTGLTKSDYQSMSSGERTTAKLLDSMNLYYEYALIPKFLHGLHLDFYVPSLKLGIEYDGAYHFHIVGYDNYDNNLINTYLKRRRNDKQKDYLCKHNKINLLRIEDYKREAYRSPVMLKLLNLGLSKAKYLFHNNKFGYVIHYPKNYKYLHVNKSMIENALPLNTDQKYKEVCQYLHYDIKNKIYYAIAETLITSFMHTKDVIKLKYDDLISNGKIKKYIRTSNYTICNKRLWYVNSFLQNILQNYIKYLKNNNINSEWLFPDPNNSNKHISFECFSDFSYKLGHHFNLKHFNIYSFRKTGGYVVYDQQGLKYASRLLNQSDILSTAKYLGFSVNKIMDKITESINFF